MIATTPPKVDIHWEQHCREVCDCIAAFLEDRSLASLMMAQIKIGLLISFKKTQIMVDEAEYKNRYAISYGINLDEYDT
jgi:hypothetical protein